MKQFKVLALSLLLTLSTLALGQDNSSTTGTGSTPPSERAGGFVEPLILYSQNDSSAKTSQLPFIANNTSGTTSGWGVGARAGVHLWNAIFIGADGRYLRSTIKDSFYGTAAGDAYNYGGTIGVQAPTWGLRVWGTYILGGQFDPAPGNSGFDVQFNNPQGWRGGVGFHISTVSLNLEYENLIYNTTNVQSFGIFPGTSSSNVAFASMGTSLSLSFPVDL